MVMSQTWVSVEWLLNEIKTYFSFVPLKSQVRIGRSSHRRCSVNPRKSATLLKRRLWHRCFPVNFAKFLWTAFLQKTSARLLLDRIKYSWQNLLYICALLQNAGTCLYTTSESNFEFFHFICLGSLAFLFM